jgi:AcrR family transcriptional regulator
VTATDQAAATAPGNPGDRRGPGRPRSADADKAIVQATLEMLADEGYHALSLEAVAASAGVGKATIYRRWPGKRELVSDALATLNEGMPDVPPASAPTVERVRQLMEHACRKDPQSLSGRIMPRMMSYRTSHPELYKDYVQRVLEPRRERLRTVLRDGIERGDLRVDLDVELAALTLTAPLIMMTMGSVSGQAPPAGTVEKITDIVWPGIEAKD